MKEFLIGLFSISIFMTAVIALLLSVSKGMKNRFSVSARFFVWLLVMVRLAVPIGGIFLPSLIEIPISQAPADSEVVGDIVLKEDPDLNLEGSQSLDIPIQKPVESAPSVDNETGNLPIINDMGEKETTAEPNPGEPSKRPETDDEFKINLDLIVNIAFGVWVLGAVAFVAKNLISYATFNIWSRNNLKSADGVILETYKEMCQDMGIKKAPRLYINSVNESPYCAGYFRKRIVIPSVPFSNDELCSVLSHELCHYRRKDVWTKLLAVVGNALHWFNPLAYMAAERFEREMEHYCDEMVLRGLSEEKALEYGKTMLLVARECKGSSALTTSFNPKKKAVGERIDNILDSGKKKKRGIVVICAVAVLCIVAGVIIGVNVIGDEEPKKDVSSKDDYRVVLWHNSDGVKLCAKNEEDKKGGENVPVKLVNGKNEIYFKSDFIFHVGSRTEYYYTDVTGDGVKDHVLILPTASGTGVSEEELYVFNGEDLKEITVEDPLAFINSHMTFSSDDDCYYVYRQDEKLFELNKKVLGPYDPSLMLETPVVDCGILNYYVNEAEDGASNIRVEYCVSIVLTNGDSLGNAVVSFSYLDNKMKCTEVDFSPYCIAETNNTNWLVRGYSGYITMVNGDTYIRIDQDKGLNDFHSDANRNTLSATFDENSKLCLLTYYDRSAYFLTSNEAHMMHATLVDLAKGEVIKVFAPTFSEILSYHGASSDDVAIKEYVEDEKRLHHSLGAIDVSAERAYFYSFLASDDYRVNLRASVVIWADDRQSTYFAQEPILPEDSTEIYDILDELRDMKGVDTHLATAATAFINKDTLVLENHLGCMCGVLESYKNFEFGKYSFSMDEGVLKLHIEIKKSSIETVPAGDYTIEFQRGILAAVTMSGIGAYEYYGNGDEKSDAVMYTNRWISGFGLYKGSVKECIDSINDSENDSLKNDVIKYIWQVSGDENSKLNTPDEYKKAAKDIFGVDDFDIPESMIDGDGNVVRWGHGGRICMTYVFPEEREGNTVTVKVRAYADFACTVESHLYEFKYEDHGDFLKIVSIIIVEESKYEPENRYVA